MNNGLETRYFLSALTGAGYYALHRQFLRPPERYFCILKGGPGCGKSTFLKRVGDAGQAAGLAVVRLHCAGDPASLDGVYFPEKRSGFFDGTAPHTVDPALFGASGEYLDLGTFCRTEALDTARIRALNADCAMFRLRAQQYLAAAAALDARATPGLVYPEDREAARRSDKKKVVVLGAGPIRIGQGVEFDYSTVHAVQTIRRAGYEAIIINNNPETVSTDYTTADKLYFEPLTPEDVMNILHEEQADQVIASLGGQTAINLAQPLMTRGVQIIGTDCAAIERAENRDCFEKLLLELNIPQPMGAAVTNLDDGLKAAHTVGYPVLVRPSFVLGGRAMEIVADDEMLRHYLQNAVRTGEGKPVLVDKYISGREVEVDAICDGRDVFVPGIMELVERTGVHSGDSISVYPPFSISDKVKGTILTYAKKLGLGIGIVGLYNIQFIVDKSDHVYIIEVNPRSSRTVPFLSKATGYQLADIATNVILGTSLKEQGIFDLYPPEKERCYVKAPVFSFAKLHGLDAYLSPEMKSTGEAIGYDKKLSRAMYKALQASGMNVQNYGTVFVTLADEDKPEGLPLVRRFYEMGFNIEATAGTAAYLKSFGIRTRVRGKISDGSHEILDSIRSGYVSYIINTRSIHSSVHAQDGAAIRRCAVENGVTVFTSLDTVRVLLDVLEETTLAVSTIHAE